MAVTFLFLSWVSSYSWPFVSAVFAAGSFIILAGGLIYRWHKRREYSKLLKAPFDTDFYIPKAIEHKVDYHLQDDSPHSEQELTLPPNSEHVVMIRSKARLDVALIEVLYGCMDYEKGIAYLNAMPEPLYYFNPWVKTGIRKEIHPDRDPDHYVDKTNSYHIICHGRVRPKGSDLLHGLWMKTKERGTYKFRVAYVMPCGEAESFLTINVSDRPQ